MFESAELLTIQGKSIPLYKQEQYADDIADDTGEWGQASVIRYFRFLALITFSAGSSNSVGEG
jgi:hypothetical protein